MREVLTAIPGGPCIFSFPVTFDGSGLVRALGASSKGALSFNRVTLGFRIHSETQSNAVKRDLVQFSSELKTRSGRKVNR